MGDSIEASLSITKTSSSSFNWGLIQNVTNKIGFTNKTCNSKLQLWHLNSIIFTHQLKSKGESKICFVTIRWSFWLLFLPIWSLQSRRKKCIQWKMFREECLKRFDWSIWKCTNQKRRASFEVELLYSTTHYTLVSFSKPIQSFIFVALKEAFEFLKQPDIRY